MTEEKYDANLGAHREGMTPEEVATYYSEWARNKKYDEVSEALWIFVDRIYTSIPESEFG
jgi:hypothetical protein